MYHLMTPFGCALVNPSWCNISSKIIFLVKEKQHFYSIACQVLNEGLRVEEYVYIYLWRRWRWIFAEPLETFPQQCFCLHMTKDKWIKDHGLIIGLKIILRHCQWYWCSHALLWNAATSEWNRGWSYVWQSLWEAEKRTGFCDLQETELVQDYHSYLQCN